MVSLKLNQKLSRAALLMTLILIAVPLKLMAWAHLPDVSPQTEVGKRYLIFKVLERHSITYCVLTAYPETFSVKTLAPQVDVALQVWTNTLEVLLDSEIKRKEVSCSQNPDLKVAFDDSFPDPYAQTLKAYETNYDGAFAYVHFRPRQFQPWPLLNFANYILLAEDQTLTDALQLFVFSNAEDSVTISQQTGLAEEKIALTMSFPKLVHEIGHAFGLCDTYGDSTEKFCDKKYRSAKQPSSIMSDEYGYLYITPDDREGLVALIKRFQQ